MKLPRRNFLHLAASAGALPAFAHIAIAQAYPSRPITIVVPFVAGGPSDLLGRMVGDRFRSSFGQPVVVENVPGANGSIGVGRVARAAPDGYTLVIGLWNTHVVNGAIYTLPYDVQKDFEPVALLSNSFSLVVARKNLPADDLKGLIDWLKANPDKATQGHVGIGSVGHIGGLLLQNMTGTRFQQVPYRGSAPVMQALLGGQIDFGIESAMTSLPQYRAGSIKAFAVAGQTPLIVQNELAGVGLVALARVDGVVEVRDINRNQARNHRLAVVPERKPRKPVRAQVPTLKSVDLVLLAMFQAVEESIPIGGLNREPPPSGA